ncbi:MAG: bifunctional phosphoglucose/phosphomannose isomerase [Candidatus Moraniibacteriota bacterium]|jgi:glucose/mannose-6-phosphate isomerase
MNNKIDKSDLRRVILSTSEQFAEGFAAAKDITVNADFSRIMISGMGGSALPANVLRMYINEFALQYKNYVKVDVYQNRFYSLPPEAYVDCLNLICSHSGNTEETIASFQEALDNNLPCIGISAGGTVEEMCKKNGVPHIKLPIPYENFQPRTATGHFVAVMIQLLVNAGKLSQDAIANKSMTDNLKEGIAQLEIQGKEIAKRLVGKTPVVYASTKFKALAMIWKIKINENAKTPAFWNYFPELNHNEFVGFTNPQSKFYVLMLRDSDDHPRNLLRYEATAKFLEEKGVETEIIDIPEGDILYRAFVTIALSDWISYYLALEYNQDPTPVDMVEDFKKALK